MTLEKQDAELFYQLWFPLLDFVNKKYKICPQIKEINQGQGIAPSDAKAIANYLWSHTEVLREYLAEAQLCRKSRLRSWQDGCSASRESTLWSGI